MRALVTGGSGFLGRHLIALLLRQGAEVSALLRPSSSFPAHEAVRVIRTELAGEISPDAAAAMARATHVFHCAGCSTDWAPFQEYDKGNVGATAWMLRLAQEHGGAMRRFVHVSTTDVYGYPRAAGDESLPLLATPLPYNRTKLLADRLALRAAATDGLPITIVRPSSIYGSGGKAFVDDIVTLLHQRLMLLVDGGRVRGGFVHAQDVCRGMLLAAESPAEPGRAYNLSSCDDVTWFEYTRALAAVSGLKKPWLRLPFRAAMGCARVSEVPHGLGIPGRPLLTRHAVYLLGRDQQYDIARARVELGWKPEISLAEGIAESLSGRA